MQVYSVILCIVADLVLNCIFTAIFCEIFKSDGLEFVNPFWLYEQVRVNWIGAFLMAIVFNILTLTLAVGYWIYKLCTVGRKESSNDATDFK